MVAYIEGIIGLVTEQLYPLRTVRFMATCAGVGPAASLFVCWPFNRVAFALKSLDAGMGFVKYVLMTVLAESVAAFSEQFVILGGMRFMAFQALSVLHRRVDNRLDEF